MISLPYLIGSTFAMIVLKRKSPRPGSKSSVSKASPESDIEGQYNRNSGQRPISNRRRRNCARCVIT